MNFQLTSASLLLLMPSIFASIIPQQHSGIQSYRVKGRLMCADLPAANVRVKLIDDDFGPDPDDDLDSGYTDSMGNFVLAGDTTELTTIDPHLKICKLLVDSLKIRGLTP
uniref:Transthyretin-like family protein n=1 Tax=Globodera pallida TaxID=36090 RepID=A0A183C753_GLOPA